MQTGIQLIVLKGAPGSGKTQAGKSLARYFKNGVRLEVDKIRQMVISVEWENQNEHIQMLDIAANMTIDFTNKKYSPVILIDTFSGDKINKFLEDIEKHIPQEKIRVFAMYVSNDELKKRLDQRDSSEFKDWTVCKKLNDDTLKWTSPREILIDTTGLAADQAAQIMFNYLNR